jgi:hypothetical protein
MEQEPGCIYWIDETTGLRCLAVRNVMNLLYGYVGIPQGHPWYGKEYDDDALKDVEVHGGLTFSAYNIKKDGQSADDNLWWLGFDCGHYGDLIHNQHELIENNHRNISYAQAECRKLASQAMQGA